jgi:hypothetical protein
MNKKDLLYQRISQHGANLNKIFNTKYNNIELSKKVFRLENKANKIAVDYCNGNIDLDQWEIEKDIILKRLNKILDFSSKNIPVFFNGDSRGYSLKIDDDYVRKNNIDIYKDFGGYGIIAPDFREE